MIISRRLSREDTTRSSRVVQASEIAERVRMREGEVGTREVGEELGCGARTDRSCETWDRSSKPLISLGPSGRSSNVATLVSG